MSENKGAIMLFSDDLHFVANGYIRQASGYPMRYSGMVSRIYVGETVLVGSIVTPSSSDEAFMRCLATVGGVIAPGVAMCLQPRTGAGYVLALFNGHVDYKPWATAPILGAVKATTTLTADGVVATNDEININGKVYAVSVDGAALTRTATMIAAAALGNLYTVAVADTAKGTFQTAFDLVLAVANPELEITTAWSSDDLVISFAEAGAHGNAAVTTKTTGANLAFTGANFVNGAGTGNVYLEEGATTGLFSLTAPDTSNDVVQVLGTALTPRSIFFNPVTDYDLVA